jgi:uncharacterized protein (DUF1330 family)
VSASSRDDAPALPGSIEPTPEQFARLATADDDGPIVMLNLLRFRPQAGGIDAEDAITGAEAYGRYGVAVQRHLERVGGRVVLVAAPEQAVIAPEGEEWDLVILAEYPSRRAFLEMTTDPGYLEIHAHRAAALADSRLIACKMVSS